MNMTLKTRQTANNVLMVIKPVLRAKTDGNRSQAIAFCGERAEYVTADEAVQVRKDEIRKAADEAMEIENAKQRPALERAESQNAKHGARQKREEDRRLCSLKRPLRDCRRRTMRRKPTSV